MNHVPARRPSPPAVVRLMFARCVINDHISSIVRQPAPPLRLLPFPPTPSSPALASHSCSRTPFSCATAATYEEINYRLQNQEEGKRAVGGAPPLDVARMPPPCPFDPQVATERDGQYQDDLLRERLEAKDMEDASSAWSPGAMPGVSDNLRAPLDFEQFQVRKGGRTGEEQ